MDELKPCPFCGGKANVSFLNETKDGKQYDAYSCCPKCDIGFVEKTLEKAVFRWNTRAVTV